eukprot:scaffold294_cov281-Pinguiococcus_pyrenoidosus.AAC.6
MPSPPRGTPKVPGGQTIRRCASWAGDTEVDGRSYPVQGGVEAIGALSPVLLRICVGFFGTLPLACLREAIRRHKNAPDSSADGASRALECLEMFFAAGEKPSSTLTSTKLPSERATWRLETDDMCEAFGRDWGALLRLFGGAR